ncbi:hypothetical protein BHM03_00051412 [Ensete ventricosum]|nr:hypothetical protein BHM03_00051412 [Ensete ventricosum]
MTHSYTQLLVVLEMMEMRWEFGCIDGHLLRNRCKFTKRKRSTYRFGVTRAFGSFRYEPRGPRITAINTHAWEGAHSRHVTLVAPRMPHAYRSHPRFDPKGVRSRWRQRAPRKCRYMRSRSGMPPPVLDLTVQIRIRPRAPVRGILPQLAPLPYLCPHINLPSRIPTPTPHS